MSETEQLFWELARSQAQLAKEFAAVGEVAMARIQFQSAINKLAELRTIATDRAAIDKQITEWNQTVSQLGTPDHGQKRSHFVFGDRSQNNQTIMSHEVATTDKLDLSVLTAEQGALLDKLKLYGKAEDHNRLEKKFLAYYRGRAANALKEITDKGQFVPLLNSIFPEKTVRWLQFCMNFSTAVDIGKNAPVRLLPDSRLLKGETLSKTEEEKIGEAVLKVTGDKGIMKTITDWKKKLAREKLKDAPPIDDVQREKAHQAAMALIGETAHAALTRYVDLKLVDKSLVPVAIRKAIDALCVRNGREAKHLKKFKVAARPAKQ